MAMIDLHQEPYFYMSEEDKKQVRDAQRRNFNFPRYRVTGPDSNDEMFVREAFFTPAQFRAITGAPFPECANHIQCQRLIAIWNKTAPRHTYELIAD